MLRGRRLSQERRVNIGRLMQSTVSLSLSPIRDLNVEIIKILQRNVM